jgi:hypothetical protein
MGTTPVNLENRKRRQFRERDMLAVKWQTTLPDWYREMWGRICEYP